MRFLLDTHTFIWASLQSTRLSPTALDLITDTSNEVWVSVICAYEIEYKRSRDAELSRMPPDLDQAVSLLQLQWRPLTAMHAICGGQLPLVDRDPFDRLLAAQAIVDGLTLISRDRAFANLGCSVAW